MLLICFTASVRTLAAEPEASSGSSPATEPSLQELSAHMPLVEEAYSILNRTSSSSADPSPGDAGRTSELVTEFDRLIGQRQRYFDWADELVSSGSRSADMLPRFRGLRDSHQSLMNQLPVNSLAHRTIRPQWQALNLQIGHLEEQEQRAEDDSPAHKEELRAQLFILAQVLVHTTFAHFEVAKARLEQEVLNRALNVQAANIFDTLIGGYAQQALQFNAAVIESPQLTRRSSIVEGRIVNQVRGHGEIDLAGASFNRQVHCRLAEMKAWEALRSLAQRIGVAVRGETRERCTRTGNKVGVWLSVPQENVVHFRASEGI